MCQRAIALYSYPYPHHLCQVHRGHHQLEEYCVASSRTINFRPDRVACETYRWSPSQAIWEPSAAEVSAVLVQRLPAELAEQAALALTLWILGLGVF